MGCGKQRFKHGVELSTGFLCPTCVMVVKRQSPCRKCDETSQALREPHAVLEAEGRELLRQARNRIEGREGHCDDCKLIEGLIDAVERPVLSMTFGGREYSLDEIRAACEATENIGDRSL